MMQLYETVYRVYDTCSLGLGKAAVRFGSDINATFRLVAPLLLRLTTISGSLNTLATLLSGWLPCFSPVKLT